MSNVPSRIRGRNEGRRSAQGTRSPDPRARTARSGRSSSPARLTSPARNASSIGCATPPRVHSPPPWPAASPPSVSTRRRSRSPSCPDPAAELPSGCRRRRRWGGNARRLGGAAPRRRRHAPARDRGERTGLRGVGPARRHGPRRARRPLPAGHAARPGGGRALDPGVHDPLDRHPRRARGADAGRHRVGGRRIGRPRHDRGRGWPYSSHGGAAGRRRPRGADRRGGRAGGSGALPGAGCRAQREGHHRRRQGEPVPPRLPPARGRPGARRPGGDRRAGGGAGHAVRSRRGRANLAWRGRGAIGPAGDERMDAGARPVGP